MQTPKTQSELKDLYLALAKAEDTTTDVTQYSDFDNKGTVIGGVVADAELDVYNAYDNLVPQNADALGVNLQLSARGGVAQLPQTQAQLTLNVINTGITPDPTKLTPIPVISFNIPIGTILTATNGTVYKVVNNINNGLNFVLVNNVPTVDPTPPTNTFYVLCNNLGSGNGQPVITPPTLLNISPPIQSTDGGYTLNSVSITGSIDGSTGETDAQAQQRLLNLLRTPLAGTRSTDYQNTLLKYVNFNPNFNITDVIVLNANNLLYESSPPPNLGLYLVSGNPVDDAFLNNGLINTTEQQYSRSSTDPVIGLGKILLQSLDFIGVFPEVSSVYTRTFATTVTVTNLAFFQIQVTLRGSYGLDTPITLAVGVSLTVKQLIQREVRRAICSQPYGATLTVEDSTNVYTKSYITTSSIEQQLDNALGTSSKAGTLGSFLLDREVLIYDTNSPTNYSYQPFIAFDPNDSVGIPNVRYSNPLSPINALLWVYDVANANDIYSNITVIQNVTSGLSRK